MDVHLAIDSAVLLLYFVLIISIGLYMGRKEEDLKDFALGGRRIPWWAVLASLIAAETSAGTFFGTPGEGFTHRNYTYLQLAIGTIMIVSAFISLGLLYSAIPGGWNEIVARHGSFHFSDFITTGFDPAKHGWQKILGMFGIEYTIFAGLFGSTFITMGTHGTDQDMVQRMLTAPDIRRSRRSVILSGLADIPIAFTFISIGILLWVYYQAHPDPTLPKTPNETFCHFILYQMPVGLRGLLLAGIFATAMGSLSTALNALATSFTRDWYEPYINPASTSEQSLRAVRCATVWFSV